MLQTSIAMTVSLSYQVEFFVNSLYLLKSITEVFYYITECFALSPQAKHPSTLHEVTDVFIWTY